MGLSTIPFSSLKGQVTDKTLEAIADMGFEYMTDIQAEVIPHLLTHKDALVSSKTGSGKTLAFLIPAIELLHKLKFAIYHGTGIIILSPTRELSLQTHSVVKSLLKYHSQTCALIMGGADRKKEAEKLSKGVSVLVATPGRLIDHIKNTPNFVFKNLQCLIIDEADKMFDVGFEMDMKYLIHFLPQYRVNLLFSATINQQTDGLANIFLRKTALHLGTAKDSEIIEEATVSTLKQGFILCPSERRFDFLHSFLRQKFRKKKIIVFFSSVMSVRFHHDVFNYTNLKCSSIHGKMKQEVRTRNFLQFCKAKSGVLLCTDVAARGLDIPKVDWIVQFDPPTNPKEYIHRVGRTARGTSLEGNALLVLRKEETKFLSYLKQAKVPMQYFEYDWDYINNKFNVLDEGPKELQRLVKKFGYLRALGKEAYISYVRAYRSHQLKDVFNEDTLNLKAVALSFGYPFPPCKKC